MSFLQSLSTWEGHVSFYDIIVSKKIFSLQWGIILISYIIKSVICALHSCSKHFVPSVGGRGRTLTLRHVLPATCRCWEITYWHKLLEWVGQVFALRDRPVFLMAEHIYLALVKHIPYREANWLRFTPLPHRPHPATIKAQRWLECQQSCSNQFQLELNMQGSRI